MGVYEHTDSKGKSKNKKKLKKWILNYVGFFFFHFYSVFLVIRLTGALEAIVRW